jgi:hypothetical protein
MLKPQTAALETEMLYACGAAGSSTVKVLPWSSLLSSYFCFIYSGYAA